MESLNSPICLLDDDLSVLRATSRLLFSAGWDAKTFSEPIKFLDYYGEHHPPVAVIDVSMPAMSGLEVQRRLLGVSPTTKVIILTSKDDPSIRDTAVGAGAVAFFAKPFQDDVFLAAIASALTGPS